MVTLGGTSDPGSRLEEETSFTSVSGLGLPLEEPKAKPDLDDDMEDDEDHLFLYRISWKPHPGSSVEIGKPKPKPSTSRRDSSLYS